ncbi:Calcitonin gene-related peptide type 1 receptor, partial [Pseudolycoriella hygida]
MKVVLTINSSGIVHLTESYVSNGKRNTNKTDTVMSNEEISPEVKELMTKLYRKCEKTHGNAHFNDKENQLYCPYRFDGYVCWPRTLAGTTVYEQCPNFVTGFNDNYLAYKECHKNGTWFTHPETGSEWSNYTTCVDVTDLAFRQFVNEFYVIGYILSLLTLVVSLIVFLSFRSLKCTRIRIHIQLFTSLALTCIAWLVWYKFIVERPDTIRYNS